MIHALAFASVILSFAFSSLANAFQVFDATLYLEKSVDFSSRVRPIYLIDEHVWGKEPKSNLPPKEAFMARLRAVPNGAHLVLDFEQWPTSGGHQVVQQSLDKFSEVISWVKSERTDVSVGLYGALPVRDYWRAIHGQGQDKYREWQKENDHLSKFSSKVDALYPSLYTFYEDVDGWRKYATQQIAEARRIGNGRPVYVFLWPEFHDSTPNKGRELSPSFWRVQLDTACQLADGIVIWGGWDFHKWKRKTWNSPLWWKETAEFLRQRETCGVRRPSAP